MANEKNLKVLSPNEARENGQKGGIISGQVRRERKKLRDIVMTMASVPISTNGIYDNCDYLKKFHIDNPTFMDAIIAQIIDKAKRGDIRAIKIFLEIIGDRYPQFSDFDGQITQQELKVSYKAKKQTVE